MPNIEQAVIDYEKMLLEATEYTGNKDPGKKVFSASMLGEDMLVIYLKYFHGSKKQTVFGMNTLGSMYQLGVDVAADTWNEKHNVEQYKSATRFSYTLSNGWEISGETDQIDEINKVIFDNKVSQTKAISNVISEGKDNSYALQQGVYKFLIYKKQIADGVKNPIIYPAVLPMVDKKFSHYNVTNKFTTLTFQELETYTPDEIEEMLLEQTNELQRHIDHGITPDKCSNTWPFSRKGQPFREMRCMFYCDQADHCEYVSEFAKMKNLMAQL